MTPETKLLLSVTARTKRAVRQWSTIRRALLDTKLADLRPNALIALLAQVNQEFTDANGFPIDANDWPNINPLTVRALRDECFRRIKEAS